MVIHYIIICFCLNFVFVSSFNFLYFVLKQFGYVEVIFFFFLKGEQLHPCRRRLGAVWSQFYRLLGTDFNQ